jgi:hypothetical protein
MKEDLTERLEERLHGNHKYIVGAIIRAKAPEEGRVRVLEVYETEDQMIKDYPRWFEWSSVRSVSEKRSKPILPFKMIGDERCIPMVYFLAEYHSRNKEWPIKTGCKYTLAKEIGPGEFQTLGECESETEWEIRNFYWHLLDQSNNGESEYLPWQRLDNQGNYGVMRALAYKVQEEVAKKIKSEEPVRWEM